MKEQYGEFEIVYNEQWERFEALQDGKVIRFSTKLSSLKESLDREKKKNYPRTKVFLQGRHDFEFGEVTSPAQSDIYGNYYWFVSKSKDKRKISEDGIYRDNEKNNFILKNILTHQKDIEAIEEKINMLIDSLEEADLSVYKDSDNQAE